MTQKLFAFVAGECAAESTDNPMFQEALLSGHLYQMVLKVCDIIEGPATFSPAVNLCVLSTYG